jgi:hypothetical protein
MIKDREYSFGKEVHFEIYPDTCGATDEVNFYVSGFTDDDFWIFRL